MPPILSHLKTRWLWWLGLLAAIVAAVLMLQHLLAPRASAWLEEYAREAGIELRAEVQFLGFTGGSIAEAEVSGPGYVARAEDLHVGWSIRRLFDGQLNDVSVEQLTADLDLAYFFPVESSPLALLSPATVEEVSPATMSAGSVSARGSGTGGLGAPRRDPAGGGSWMPGRDAVWPRLPLEALSIRSGAVRLRYHDKLLPFEFETDYAAASEWQTLRLVLTGDRFGGAVQASTGLSDAAWSAQGSWYGTNPGNLLTELFPRNHPLSPLASLPASVESVRLGAIEIAGLVEGTGSEVTTLSALATVGPVEVQWHDGTSVRTRSSSGGVSAREGKLAQVEAVVDVGEIRAFGARTEGFMMNVGWSAGESGDVEIPEVRVLYPDREVAATLSARGSLAAEGAAELQLAFQEVHFQDWKLEPFRWFINEQKGTAQGRLSALRLAGSPDWQLVRTSMSVTHAFFPGMSDLIGADWTADATTTIEYRPQMRALGRVEVTARADGEETAWGLEVIGELGESLGTLRGRSSVDALDVDGGGEWQLADFVPYLFLLSDSVRGIQGGGIARWQAALKKDPLFLISGRFGLELENARLSKAQDRWAAEGIQASLGFELRGPFPRSQGPQEVRVDLVRFGNEVVRNLVVRFEWVHRNEFRVLSCAGEWGGGRIAVEPFSFDPMKPDFGTRILFRDLDAAVIADEDAAGMRFRVEGILDGVLPLRFSAERGLELFQGQLSARSFPQAMLYFADEASVAEVIQLPEQFGLRKKVVDALMAGIQLKRFAVDLLDPDQPLRPILIEFEGAVENPEVQFEGITIRMPHTIDRELAGWRALLFIFSGGTM